MEVLSPGMEHREKAGFHAQAFWVAGNGEQGFGGGAEEQVVGGLFVIEGDGGDGLGECADHVKILGGQQLGAALLQPLFPCRPLALGAMTVAAGPIAGVRVLAVVAPFDNTAQRRSAAILDGLQQTMLMQG